MHKISEWERAIRRREDIIYNEIYLKDGLVETVIGAVLIPCRVVRGETRARWRKVRWNKYGICLNVNGTLSDMLEQYNIRFTNPRKI